MKLTKEQLTKIIKEELSKLQEDGHEDVSSARRKLKTTIEDASEILQSLESAPEQELPSWWMSKITIVGEYINKARDYLLVSGDTMTEGYRDYDPDDEFTDSRTKSGGTSASSGGFRGYTDTEGPLSSRSGGGGGYSSHTGRLGDEQHDGSYEIPKFKVPSNLTPKQKESFKYAFDSIKYASEKGKGGPYIIDMIDDMAKYGKHDRYVLMLAYRAYAQQLKEVNIGPGDQTIQGIEPQHDESNRVRRMRQRAIDLIDEMSPKELERLLKQINPET